MVLGLGGKAHDSGEFNTEDFQQEPAERGCLPAARCMWLRRLCRRRSIQLGSLFFTTLNLALLFNFVISTLQHPLSHLLYKVDPFKLPVAEEDFLVGDLEAVSFFSRWLQRDLDPWRATGITHDVLEDFAKTKQYRECWGEVMRFQIINGSLWVDHISERHNGWYPAELGEGAVSGKGKIPYSVLTLLDTLRHFPGQIPDLDAYLQTSDFPCIRKAELDTAPGRGLVPIFGYSSNAEYTDIPFPDYTYWGHEYSRLTDRHGYYLHGWRRQHDFLLGQYGQQPLADRRPQTVWRGRTQDARYPERDALRRTFVKCGKALRDAGRPADAKLFDETSDIAQLYDNCRFRYPIVLESGAWTTNMKQKLTCGSVLLSNKLYFYDFFTRALTPGVHFVEVDSDNICEDVVDKVQSINAAIEAEGKQSLQHWTADYDKRRRAQLQRREEVRQESIAQQVLAAGEEPLSRPGQPGQQQGLGGLLSRAGMGASGSVPLRQQMLATAPAQGPGNRTGRHRQLRLTQHARPQRGEAGRSLSASAAGERGAGLAQRMHGMDAETPGPMAPWEIAKAGQEFVGDHLGMDEVRLYIRDVLKEYAALQVFDDNLWPRVQPSWNAVHYTGDLLLEQFAYPYRYDYQVVLQAYPWLKGNSSDADLESMLARISNSSAPAPTTSQPEQPASDALQ